MKQHASSGFIKIIELRLWASYDMHDRVQKRIHDSKKLDRNPGIFSDIPDGLI